MGKMAEAAERTEKAYQTCVTLYHRIPDEWPHMKAKYGEFARTIRVYFKEGAAFGDSEAALEGEFEADAEMAELIAKYAEQMIGF